MIQCRGFIHRAKFIKRYCSNMSTTDGKLYSQNGDFVFYKSRVAKDNTKPGIVFCSGYQSNLNGNKAEYLDHYCKVNNLGYVRFDYIGHEFSSGTILDATLSLWKQNLLDVLDKLTQGPQILVGSSIGGWVSLLGAIERPDKIHGLIGIANATDTMHRKYLNMTEEERDTIQKVGYFKEKTGFIVPHNYFMDCQQHLLLNGERPVPIQCPVRLIHGMQDDVVPYVTTIEIAEKIASNDVLVHLVKNGDHRMSTESDLELLGDVLDKLLSRSVSSVNSAKL